jgi:hypothetical protein
VEVAALELNEVDLAVLTDSLEVLLAQHSPFPQIGPQVMDEHASFNVAGLGACPVQTDRFH